MSRADNHVGVSMTCLFCGVGGGGGAGGGGGGGWGGGAEGIYV